VGTGPIEGEKERGRRRGVGIRPDKLRLVLHKAIRLSLFQLANTQSTGGTNRRGQKFGGLEEGGGKRRKGIGGKKRGNEVGAKHPKRDGAKTNEKRSWEGAKKRRRKERREERGKWMAAGKKGRSGGKNLQWERGRNREGRKPRNTRRHGATKSGRPESVRGWEHTDYKEST